MVHTSLLSRKAFCNVCLWFTFTNDNDPKMSCWDHAKSNAALSTIHSSLYTSEKGETGSNFSYKVVISVWLSFWTCCTCWFEAEADLPFVLGSLWSFFHFILLFWNQILIWRSERQRVWAISMRRRLVRYLLKWNSFSSSKTCCLV